MYDCCPYDVTEIESTGALRRHLQQGRSLQNVVVQGINLAGSDVEALLTSVPAEDACFLGCELSDAAEQHVRERYPDRAESLAVPTWFYGHEPSNLFSTHVAKYFANSIREDGLLAIATYGVVYAPGSAGTIQEVFMDAAQNHYETFGPASPMVFLDRTYWTETKPVYPLLETLAEGTAYDGHLTATDDIETAVSLIEEHAPKRGASEQSSSTLDP